MSDLRPGTTMHRIAELERVTRDLRQDTRELRGLLEAGERRVSELEDALDPDDLRALYQDAVDRYWDTSAHEAVLGREREDLRRLDDAADGLS